MILHADGDAFFVACEMARRPALRGRPVVVGADRGIATALSYEAKALGVTRGLPIFKIKRLFPEVIILPGDYDLYLNFSRRVFDLVRRFSPRVEEYSVDECFAELDYPERAALIKEALAKELGLSFSVGLGASKVLAKAASRWRKPAGLTAILPGQESAFLAQIPITKVWGIGPNTGRFLLARGIQTAAQFVRQEEWWIREHLARPFHELWRELRGESVWPVQTAPRSTYQSISRTSTFTPPSKEPFFLLAQLSQQAEAVCAEARNYHLVAKGFGWFLKTQDFSYQTQEIKLTAPTNLPSLLVPEILASWPRLFRSGCLYRTTGVTLTGLVSDTASQLNLFSESGSAGPAVFGAVDQLTERYREPVVFLASSLQARSQKPPKPAWPIWGEVS